MNVNTISFISDIHLEFDKRLKSYSEIVDKKYSDIIILAGDIDVGDRAIGFVKHLLELGYTVIYVLGNHEYYDSSISNVEKFWNDLDLPNFYFLQNNTVYFDNIRIIGTTLWASAGTTTIHPVHGTVTNTDIDPTIKYSLERGMTDFSIIDDFGVSEMVDLFNKSVTYIFDEVSTTFQGKTIVVTHHAPSERSSLEQYKNSVLNDAFYSPLDILIDDSNIDVWIHGHMHNSSDYMIGNCRVLCNPRGYKDVYELNSHYKGIKTIGL